MLPKKGKDPLDPASYRPISLINVDAKILSKIPANRLAPIIPFIINRSQPGFVRGRFGIANIRKVLAALEIARQNPSKDNIIIALDEEKAFDNIDLDWLLQVKNTMFFQGSITSFLQAQ